VPTIHPFPGILIRSTIPVHQLHLSHNNWRSWRAHRPDSSFETLTPNVVASNSRLRRQISFFRSPSNSPSFTFAPISQAEAALTISVFALKS
jgi:hypothetical protein